MPHLSEIRLQPFSVAVPLFRQFKAGLRDEIHQERVDNTRLLEAFNLKSHAVKITESPAI